MNHYSDYSNDPFRDKSQQDSFYVQGGFKQKGFIEKNQRRSLVNLIHRIDGFVGDTGKKQGEFTDVKKELIGAGKKIFEDQINQFNFMKDSLLRNLEKKKAHLEATKDVPTQTLRDVNEKKGLEKEIKNLQKKLNMVISLIHKFDEIKHRLDRHIATVPKSKAHEEIFSLEAIKKTFAGLSHQSHHSHEEIELLRNIQKDYQELVHLYDLAINIESELTSEQIQRSQVESMKKSKSTCLRLVKSIMNSTHNHTKVKRAHLQAELANQSKVDTSFIENYLTKLNEKIIRNESNLEQLQAYVANTIGKKDFLGDEVFERIAYLTQKINILRQNHTKAVIFYEIAKSSIKTLNNCSNQKNLDIDHIEQLFDRLIYNYNAVLDICLSGEQELTRRKEEFLDLRDAKKFDHITVDLLLHAYNELKIESERYLDFPNDFKSKRAKKLISQIEMLTKHYVSSISFEKDSDFKSPGFAFIINFLMKLQIATRALPENLGIHHSKLASFQTGLFTSNTPIDVGPAVALKIWCMNYMIDKAAHVIAKYKKENRNNEPSQEALLHIKLIEEIVSGYGWATQDPANYISFGLSLTESTLQLAGSDYSIGIGSFTGLVSSGATLASIAKENPIGRIEDEKIFLKHLIAEKEKELKTFPHLKSLHTLIEILKLRLEFISNRAFKTTLYSVGSSTLDFLNSATAVGGTIAGIAAPAAATTAIAITGYATAGISVFLLSLGGMMLYLNQKRVFQSQMKIEEHQKHLEGINKKLEYLVANFGVPKHMAKGDPSLKSQYAGLNSEKFIQEYKNLQHQALACKQIIAKELDRKFIGNITDLDDNTRIEIEKIRNEIQKKIASEQTYLVLLDFFLDNAREFVDQFKMDPATAILDYVYATSLT